MNPPPFPEYSVRDLEKIARDLLRERWPTLAIPVDIDLIVEREPGVVLDTLRGLKELCGVAGATVYHPKEDRFTVFIDDLVADGNPGFYRFTVAEELGHLKLHSSVLRKVKTIQDADALHASKAYQTADRNAKWLASALLMPADPLLQDARQLYAGLVKECEFDQPALFRRLLVTRLSQKYVVNVNPMQYRLQRWPLRVWEKVDQALKDRADSLPLV